jgi:hypothetical protein
LVVWVLCVRNSATLRHSQVPVYLDRETRNRNDAQADSNADNRVSWSLEIPSKLDFRLLQAKLVPSKWGSLFVHSLYHAVVS